MNEIGQSIVIVAGAFVVLLLFAGIALDVGLGFVRSSAFSRAVDSASMAGVIDLSDVQINASCDPVVIDHVNAPILAITRTRQFLGTNGWPIEDDQLAASVSCTNLGLPQYTITVTYQVGTFFTRLIGINGFPVTHRASAAYYALTDILLPTNNDSGHLMIGSQFIIGQNGCTDSGDPVIPHYSYYNGVKKVENPDLVAYREKYRYRIQIPSNYDIVSDTINIELFDPDPVNLELDDTFSITHSTIMSMTPSTKTCLAGDGQACILETGETGIAKTINPLWFERVDENFGSDCSPLNTDPNGDTETVFELYYFDDSDNKVPIATYTPKSGENGQTDMQWVTPGEDVGVDSGSSFNVSFSSLPDAGSDPRYVFLDVASTGGTSRNVWDIRAGPPSEYYVDLGFPALEKDVNLRNLQIANFPGVYSTKGVRVFAIGRMPIDHHIEGKEVTLKIAPIRQAVEKAAAYLSIFDYDNQVAPTAVTLTVDTDNSGAFTKIYSINTDFLCDGGNDCNNSWTIPHFIYNLPSDPDGIGFLVGGTIEATYFPDGDAHTWQLYTTAGRPFLTE
jgi:hypothetical protein